jgi:hypothetical protein
MSIDPSMSVSVALKGALPFEGLEISSEAIYVFDFDGVISSALEDEIYKLSPVADEIDLLKKAADVFRIRCEGLEQQYQRHLIYQAAAWKLNLPIEPGPGFAKAKDANNRSRLFILTARSGWYATERQRLFLKQKSIFPIEIYNVGRVMKDRQIELVCREYSERKVYFVDDSIAHLTHVSKNAPPNFVAAWLENTQKLLYKETQLRRHFEETVVAALNSDWKN